MWNIETNFVTTYTDSIASAIDAFVLVWGATAGVFIAFGISEKLRFLITKMIGKG